MTEHLQLIARQLTHLQRMREYLAHSVRRRKWLDIGQLADYDRANGEFIPDNPLTSHSRAGGNPARTNTPRSGQNRDVVLLRGRFLIIWIPACAGMTQFCANGLSEFTQVLA